VQHTRPQVEAADEQHRLVDFVVTPTVGMGWIVLEDAIEAKIVDPLAGDSQSLTWKIVRGSLAPSRTMSNFLQGKLPWYRPWLYENATGRAGNLIVKSEKPKKNQSEASSWRDQPRKTIGIHYVNLSLPMDWEGWSSHPPTSQHKEISRWRPATFFDSRRLRDSGANWGKAVRTELTSS
jgi:hypothetical protein